MVQSRLRVTSPKPEEILIIEDHPDMIDILKKELTRHHYHVRVAAEGETGLSEAQRQPPDLIILDLMLPGLSGWEVCRLLRKNVKTQAIPLLIYALGEEATPPSLPLLRKNVKTQAIPLLILTALGEEANRILGLESGADDYLPKPVSLRELIARIKALLRRKRMAAEQKPGGAYRAGALVIDTERHEIRMAGRLIRLTRTEFGLLKFLAQNPGKVFKRDELITTLWGENQFVEEHNLDVHIHSIRQHLEPDPSRPQFILTVRGIGYKFRPPEETG
ncbi:MAG: response regulator transcription factor [Candidatus Manganitrophus sp.]|nr:MAG: response regulator transcription factor [Candidatus Manganitrophus sp.]